MSSRATCDKVSCWDRMRTPIWSSATTLVSTLQASSRSATNLAEWRFSTPARMSSEAAILGRATSSREIQWVCGFAARREGSGHTQREPRRRQLHRHRCRGHVSLGNGIGVSIVDADRNVIGGTGPGAGNVISGNTAWGSKSSDTELSDGSSLRRNLRQQPAHRQLRGRCSGCVQSAREWVARCTCRLEGNVIIGGIETGAANTIAYNGGDGIFRSCGVELCRPGELHFRQSGTGDRYLCRRCDSKSPGGH